MSEELSPKRRAFARDYIRDSNGTAAAIPAGFSERTAKTQASQLLDMQMVRSRGCRPRLPLPTISRLQRN